MRYPLLCIFICLSLQVKGQENDRLRIRKALQTFFHGLQEGDTATLQSVIHKDLELRTVITDPAGQTKYQKLSGQDFLRAVSQKDPDDVWLEKLDSVHLHIDRPMASVWAPYTFYRNGSLSHCGVNSIQFILIQEQWKITAIQDTRKRENCR